MANTASAKKAIRAQQKRFIKNLRHRRAFRDAKKNVQSALSTGAKQEEVFEALNKFYKEVDKAAKVNAIHKNTASRYKSRITKLVNATLEK